MASLQGSTDGPYLTLLSTTAATGDPLWPNYIFLAPFGCEVTNKVKYIHRFISDNYLVGRPKNVILLVQTKIYVNNVESGRALDIGETVCIG